MHIFYPSEESTDLSKFVKPISQRYKQLITYTIDPVTTENIVDLLVKVLIPTIHYCIKVSTSKSK